MSEDILYWALIDLEEPSAKATVRVAGMEACSWGEVAH